MPVRVRDRVEAIYAWCQGRSKARSGEERDTHIGVESPDQTDVRLGNHRNGIQVAVLECDEMDGSVQFQKGVYQEAYCTYLQTTCL